MATAKLVPGKPTVTIEGLSYEAAREMKVWLIVNETGGEVGVELDSLLETGAFRQINTRKEFAPDEDLPF